MIETTPKKYQTMYLQNMTRYKASKNKFNLLTKLLKMYHFRISGSLQNTTQVPNSIFYSLLPKKNVDI